MFRLTTRVLSKGASTFQAVRMSSSTIYKYEHLDVSFPSEFVMHVEFDRPDKLNSMNVPMWEEMAQCFHKADKDEDVRAIVLSGKGRMFTAGLDLLEAAQQLPRKEENDVARHAFFLHKFIGIAQESCTSIDKCLKPVISAVHGACIGGGVDVITACDVRMCTKDAFYSVKEVDVGLAADLGSLQRLTKIIGSDSLVRELCYTGRRMKADEAERAGLVSKVFADKEELMKGALELAADIATKSPVAVQSIKLNLNYSRDHSVDEGLQFIRSWNASMLQTEDLMKSAQALLTKKTPKDVKFSKL